MRKIMLGLAAVAVGTLGAVALTAAPAHATEECETFETVVAEIMGRPDSGLSGNWALDTFTRTAEICGDGYGNFTVVGTDEGTFTTTGPTSPGDQAAPLEAGIVGDFNGSWTAEVTNAKRDDSFDPDTNELSTGQWVLKLFTGKNYGEVGGGLGNDWAWTYTTVDCEVAETWVNSADGNSGDITEAPLTCVTPEEPTAPVSTCDEFTNVGLPVTTGVGYALSWSLVNPALFEATVVATPEDGYVFPDDAVTEWTFELTPAGGCEGPGGPPGPPGVGGADGTGGGDDESGLPVTGDRTKLMAAGGLGAVTLGGALFALWFYLNRRRQVSLPTEGGE